MKYQVLFFAALGLAIAKPYPQSECTSNAWEKVHEGHGHNINSPVPGALNLPLPGGSGCYKGKKVAGGAGSGKTSGPPGALGKGAKAGGSLKI